MNARRLFYERMRAASIDRVSVDRFSFRRGISRHSISSRARQKENPLSEQPQVWTHGEWWGRSVCWLVEWMARRLDLPFFHKIQIEFSSSLSRSGRCRHLIKLSACCGGSLRFDNNRCSSSLTFFPPPRPDTAAVIGSIIL